MLKPTSKNFIHIFFICSFIFLGFGCHQCELQQSFLLNDQLKKQNPFKGYEKIIFRAGDSTIQFSGEGRTNIKQHEIISVNECDWNVREYDELNFAYNTFNIHFHMSGRDYFDIILAGTGYDIFYNSSWYVAEDPANITGSNILLTTLSIGDEVYFNIYKDLLHHRSSEDFPDSLKYAKYLYYSTQYGIVKLDFSDGSTWELKEIIW